MIEMAKFLLLFLIVTVSGVIARDARRGEGCSASNLCCQGQRASCVAQGPRLNNRHIETCYCDEICVLLGDCCLDYRQHCPAVDCVLSSKWSDWSECDASCGLGVQVRSRAVLVEPKNGGRRCGDVADMLERRQCEGRNCKVARASQGTDELKETAEIVPAAFAQWRSSNLYSPFEDIRQNLFLEQDQYAELRRDKERPSYCAKYKITEARQSCQRPADWMSRSRDDNEAWIKKLVRGTVVCVECQHSAMHKSLGNRCFGHGVLQRQTQWKAVTIPQCHGSWIMTSRHLEPCQCDPTRDVSFVFV